jgi:hypothetical protein
VERQLLCIPVINICHLRVSFGYLFQDVLMNIYMKVKTMDLPVSCTIYLAMVVGLPHQLERAPDFGNKGDR